MLANKTLAALPAVFALAACSGGDSGTTTPSGDSGTTTPSQDAAQLLTVPSAEGQTVEYKTVEEAEAGISSLSEGDAFTLPVSEILAGETGTLTAVIGNTVGDLTTLEATFTSGDQTSVERSVQITNLSTLFTEFEEPQDTVFDTERPVVNGTTIGIGVGTGTDFSEIYASSSNVEGNFTEAQATRYIQDGYPQKRLSVDGTGTFTKPAGDFQYTGKGIVAWEENTASGDVTMSANFDTNTGNVNAPALSSSGTDTASFAGNINIDTATGHYTSTDANITVNGSRYDAGIIGTFNGDATQSSGTVFDVNTVGDTAVGAFSVAKDPE